MRWMHEIISILTNNLELILTPIQDSDDTIKIEALEKPSESPLVSKLNHNNTGIQGANIKLNTLIERLEI